MFDWVKDYAWSLYDNGYATDEVLSVIRHELMTDVNTVVREVEVMLEDLDDVSDD